MFRNKKYLIITYKLIIKCYLLFIMIKINNQNILNYDILNKEEIIITKNKGDTYMAYIKGIYIQDIYSNQTNGYTVGLIRVKESDIPEEVNRVVTFTGTFDELKYKTTYKMEGTFVEHNKYGHQFLVETYEMILPTEEEEIIDFLSSDIFPIGETTAKKIVDKLGSDTLNKIEDLNILTNLIKEIYIKTNNIDLGNVQK